MVKGGEKDETLWMLKKLFTAIVERTLQRCALTSVDGLMQREKQATHAISAKVKRVGSRQNKSCLDSRRFGSIESLKL